MGDTRVVRLVWSSAGLAFSLAAALPARAEPVTKAMCVAAYETGQTRREKSELIEARDDFRTCADASCPKVTQADCTGWLSEVEGLVPSVILTVRSPKGEDLLPRASLSGKGVAIEGKAIEVNPGRHAIRFELEGYQPLEKEITVHEGEKARRLDFVMTPTGQEPTQPGEPAVSPATWALASLGGLGLIGFAMFGGWGLAEKADAEAGCAGACSDEVVSSIRMKFIGADVSLSVGLVSGAAALVVGLVTGLGSKSADSPPVPEAALDLFPVPGGAVIGVRGTF